MLRLLFLLPLIMCFLWWLYLRDNQYTLKQGLRGFLFIIGINLVIGGFFALMLVVTN